MKKFLLYVLNIIGLLLTLFGFFRIALLISNGWNVSSLIGLKHLVILIIGLLIFIYSKKYLNSINSKVFISSTIVTIIFLVFFFMYYAPVDLIYSIFR
jgi:membrane-bound ClpP family serine protease